MSTTYPDDIDGEVLRQIAARGVDMTKPLVIEFHMIALDEESALKLQKGLAKAGYQSQIYFDEGDTDEDFQPGDERLGPCWKVGVNVEMVPEYDEVIRVQKVFTQLSLPFNSHCDGWGVTTSGL